MNKDYIKLYVDNVIIQLPISEREEVKKELTSNIYDMLNDDDSKDNVKKVLESLGSPK